MTPKISTEHENSIDLRVDVRGMGPLTDSKTSQLAHPDVPNQFTDLGKKVVDAIMSVSTLDFFEGDSILVSIDTIKIRIRSGLPQGYGQKVAQAIYKALK